MSLKVWISGLGAAIAGGVGQGLVICSQDTEHFTPFTAAGRASLLAVVMYGAAIAVVFYLAKSPVPRQVWTEEERALRQPSTTSPSAPAPSEPGVSKPGPPPRPPDD